MIPQGDFLELATGKGGTIKVLKAMHPRARRLRLSVTSHGARISYPRGTHPAQVYAFLRENSDWLERKDRKSTRLNSSHPSISYAVFCLKKKTQQTDTLP